MLAARCVLALVIIAGFPALAAPQERSSSPASDSKLERKDSNRHNALGKLYLLNLWQDQRSIWTSPARIRTGDLNWLFPLGGLTATLLYTDEETSKRIAPHTDFVRSSKQFSDYGVAAMIGASGSMYLWGRLASNEHARETGLLASEAALNGLFVNEVIKVSTQRQRPFENSGDGRFWAGGSSFPSSHAVIAWSLASVIAHEYPGILTKTFAYGGAAAISVARVSGRQHFPSDALVGSTIGYLVGRQVFRAHHNPDVSGAPIQSDSSMEYETGAQNIGSPYVPLDSWVYSAFDKLASLGMTPSAIAGLRPWTRAECARLLAEAEKGEEQNETPESVRQLLQSLREEFAFDSEIAAGGRTAMVSLDSIYSRYLGISGSPLTDGYHFASTVVNDYGRPFGAGSNVVTGISAHSIVGPVALYIQGEYQHAPPPEITPPAAAAAIAAADGIPVFQAPTSGIDRLRVIEGYATFAFANLQFSVGQQALWWGPGRSGPMVLSNNAESIPMFRISRTSPFQLPSFLSYLGPVRTEFFFGKLHGHKYIFQQSGDVIVPIGSNGPYLHGMKLSFKPTPNLEFGFSRTVLMGGFGHPLTASSLWRSITSVGDRPNTPVREDVGDRRGGFDVTYRVPRLRDWVVLYFDSMSDDDPSPLAAPLRSAWNPGIYFPQFPGLPKLEFRAEAVNTDSPGLEFSGDNYQNVIYRSGYTNYGQLLATWAGRQSKGILLNSRYSFAPQNSIEVTYRKQKVSPQFLSGGAVDDLRISGEWLVGRNLGLSTWVQYERWKFPLLTATQQQNVAFSFQLTYWPKQVFRCHR